MTCHCCRIDAKCDGKDRKGISGIAATQQSEPENGNAPLHAVDEWLFQKWENHWAAMSLWYTFYNFCRIHKSLRVTPAMEAGITDRVWGIVELLAA